MKIIKRIVLSCIALFMVISLGACSSKDKSEEQKKFDAFIQEEFVNRMESDYTTMHQYLEKPEDYGVDASKVKVNLGTRVDMKSQQKALKDAKKRWDKFESFDRDDLRDDQKDIYDNYAFNEGINMKLSDSKFEYYQQLFESISGLHFAFPTLFSDWTLRNEQDVKDVIVLMKDVSPYVDSAVQYTREQLKKGLTMIDTDEVIKYCESILSTGENSSVLTSMNANIDALKLDEGKSAAYKEQLKQAFVDSFLPAYQNIVDLMKEVKDSGKNNEEGYSKFDHGKEYYEYILQMNTGTSKSIKDIKKLINTRFENHLNDLMALMYEDQSVLENFSNGVNITTPFNSYDEILKHVSAQMKNDFPAVKDMRYEIYDVSEEIASSSGVAAYFNIPALDSSTPKQMRVNPNSGDMNSISTYTTVSHEGFPGHMYQYAYMYQNVDSNFIKAFGNNNAYSEGYAVYAQYYALNYLDSVKDNVKEVYRINELASYEIIMLADIGIHAENWSLKQFKSFLSEQGFALDDENAKTQYKQLQANPSAFEPYYFGYDEIMELKTKAQDKLKDKFKDKDFHEALLKSGSAPFNVVERNIDTYIDSVK